MKLQTGEVTDTDGNTYRTIKIGHQEWMAENLSVSTFRNGDPIPEAKSIEEWEKAGEEGKPAWCCYENDPENGNKYGKLYNWYAVQDPRGLAPEGWHIPTDGEWRSLVSTLGASAGDKMKETEQWQYYSTLATNESGFSALPGGYRSYGGHFSGVGDDASFWPAREETGDYACGRKLHSSSSEVHRNDHAKSSGFSVRCITSIMGLKTSFQPKLLRKRMWYKGELELRAPSPFEGYRDIVALRLRANEYSQAISVALKCFDNIKSFEERTKINTLEHLHLLMDLGDAYQAIGNIDFAISCFQIVLSHPAYPAYGSERAFHALEDFAAVYGADYVNENNPDMFLRQKKLPFLTKVHYSYSKFLTLWRLHFKLKWFKNRKSGSTTVAYWVIGDLEKIASPRSIPHLIRFINDNDDAIRNRAIRALSVIADPRALEPLLSFLHNNILSGETINSIGFENSEKLLCRALALIEDERAFRPLLNRFNTLVYSDRMYSERRELLEYYASAMVHTNAKNAVKPIIDAIEYLIKTVIEEFGDWEEVDGLFTALGEAQEPFAVDYLLDLFENTRSPEELFSRFGQTDVSHQEHWTVERGGRAPYISRLQGNIIHALGLAKDIRAVGTIMTAMHPDFLSAGHGALERIYGEQFDSKARRALADAITAGDLRHVEQFLNGSSKPDPNLWVPYRDEYGHYDFPLGVAAKNHKWDILMLLLERGANPNLPDEKGMIALIQSAPLEVVKALSEKGAEFVQARNTSRHR